MLEKKTYKVIFVGNILGLKLSNVFTIYVLSQTIKAAFF